MKVITFSKKFPKGHPKEGQPTWFVEKIWANIADRTDKTMGNLDMDFHEYYNCTMPKCHTIRSGQRWGIGDMASLRVWSGMPYKSKQIEFAQVEIKRTIPIKIWSEVDVFYIQIEDVIIPTEMRIRLANNDGLGFQDFIDWFSIHPKKIDSCFNGQIICWDHIVNY